MRNALKSGRLHHALLLTGPRGTGKTSTARILAKSLRCPNAVDFVPCNKCAECEEISQGRSLNVVEIDGASNNGVDAIRELRDTVAYMPSSGHFKLYIIDEVHMLSTSAFNALLKTLEEPPEHVYFVMATTEANKIPNTILSRVQRFDFRRIPTRVIASHLQTICERDGVKFEPEALWIIARQGDGSMRDSQSLLDQVINFTDGHLKRDLVVSTLGLTDRGLLLDVLTAVTSSNTAGTVEGLKRLHQSGADAKLFLLDLMEQLRNSLVLKISTDRSLVDLPDSEQEALIKMSAGLTSEDLHLLFDMALKGAQDLARASDPFLVMEMVLLRLTSAPRVSSFGGQRPTASGGSVQVPMGGALPASQSAPRPAPASAASVAAPVAAKPAQAAPAAQAQRTVPNMATQFANRQPAASEAAPTSASAPVPTPPNPNDPVEQRYKDLVEKIKEVNGLIGAQLENCSVVRMTGNHVVLGVAQKHKFLFEKINHADFKKKLMNYVTSFWGPGYTVDIQLASQLEEQLTPKAMAEKSQMTQQEALRKAVEAHPLVQSVQNVFKAEIKSIKEIPK